MSLGSTAMQVAAQNSLTWLQTTPAAVAAADQISSAYGQVSPGDDASGADTGQTAISALQSPAQMLAPISLDSLISAQSSTGSTDTAAGATASPWRDTHNHHRIYGGPQPLTSTQGPMPATTAATASATTTSADAAADSATADLEQVLTNL